MKNKKRKLKIFIFLFINFIFSAQIVFSSNDYGTTGAQILDVYSSAKIVAMGNAGVGLADDLNAVVYNSAGLTQLKKTQLQIAHIFYFVRTSINSVSYAKKINNIGFGFKLKHFSTKDTVRNENGEEQENFNIRYLQYSIGMGYPLTKKHSLGLTVNAVTEEVYDEKGNTANIDLSWHYKLCLDKNFKIRKKRGKKKKRKKFKMKKVSFSAKKARKGKKKVISNVGVTIKNLGLPIKTGGVKGKMPLKFIIGGAHHMNKKLLVVWEAFTGLETSVAFKCGMEADLNELKYRVGFNYVTNSSITIGFGFPTNNWLIDYACLYNLDLGLTHRMSLGVSFK